MSSNRGSVGFFLFFVFGLRERANPSLICSWGFGFRAFLTLSQGALKKTLSPEQTNHVSVSCWQECITHWMALPGGSPAYPSTAGLQEPAHPSDVCRRAASCELSSSRPVLAALPFLRVVSSLPLASCSLWRQGLTCHCLFPMGLWVEPPLLPSPSGLSPRAETFLCALADLLRAESVN